MLREFLKNHILANLLFGLVLIVGVISYSMLPREQDPEINFNWIVVTTVLPGAAAVDVEKRVTNPLEDAIRNVRDIKFISSTSREGVSNLLVRFEDISDRNFDKRVNDLRREIRNKEGELPEEVETPEILEITSSNAYPVATLVVAGAADDEVLRRQAHNIEKDLERITGVDRVDPRALNDPELQVRFIPELVESMGLAPTDLADTVTLHFRDTAAGSITVGAEQWLVRLIGTDSAPDYLAKLPVHSAEGEVPLESIAEVFRDKEKAQHMVSFEDKPAVILAVMKKAGANTLKLVDRINKYAEDRNQFSNSTGVRLTLVDDQSQITREALRVMQTNALFGLVFVLIVTWAFLGLRIAVLTTIGIPFTLAGTFWILSNLEQSLNVSVLLAIVIVLGMLVDDAIVVVEAIYQRLIHGMDAINAALGALKEVFAPVTTAVLTTMAAFLPLMLLPGILGDFMLVIPLVVSIALAISLIEAYWMLPSHIIALHTNFDRPSRIHEIRKRTTHWIKIRYIQFLVKVLRYPSRVLVAVLVLMLLAMGMVSGGFIKMDFFASDTLRLIYVNVEMPPSTPLQKTMDKVREIEHRVRKHIQNGDSRGIVSYAGILYTEMDPLLGEYYGQILIGLKPEKKGMRSVEKIIEDMRHDVTSVLGAENISFLKLSGGPPTAKPISVKIRGDHYPTLRKAADDLKQILRLQSAFLDIIDDSSRGRQELVLHLDKEAILESQISPEIIRRTLRLLVDGEIVADMQHEGEKLEVRVVARNASFQTVDSLLDYNLPLPNGGLIALRNLVEVERMEGLGNLRHYNFRRTVTVEADLDKTLMDTVQANNYIREEWKKIADQYPNLSLDFTGEFDDIQESLDAILVLFFFGFGLMYLILGTHFKSYIQPLMILSAIPMAFTGVTIGLLITQNPLSLFTLYGVVALAGIAVNAAIVLISAANSRLNSGMSVLHATIYASRRRVVPILITTLTTIAGLFSLATGLGGKSLIWGPVATAIVWGLVFSSTLTLLVVPLLYRLTMPFSHLNQKK